MHPKIGVLPLYNSEKQVFWINPLYFRGVEQAGGIPVLLSLTDDESLWEEYCRLYDGFVFTGGQDVDPALFGQDKIPECGYQAPLRDNQEIWMARRLRELDKPVLGICRGLQVMNVACGGTLYQDLPTQRPSAVVHRSGSGARFPGLRTGGGRTDRSRGTARPKILPGRPVASGTHVAGLPFRPGDLAGSGGSL